MATNIETLKAHAQRLAALLEEPHPGLSTWVEALHREIAAIAAFGSDQ